MKNYFKTVFLFLILFISIKSFAQDTLYRNNGETAIIRVLENSPKFIVYYLYEDTLKEKFKLDKSKISKIVYSDGLKEVYTKQAFVDLNDSASNDTMYIRPETIAINKNENSVEAQLEKKYNAKAIEEDIQEKYSSKSILDKDKKSDKQGESDANINYTPPESEAVITGVASFLFPIWGLIPAFAYSSTPKQMSKGVMLKSNNSSYVNGYLKTAKKIRSNKTWTGYAIGAGSRILASIGVVLYMLSQ